MNNINRSFLAVMNEQEIIHWFVEFLISIGASDDND